MAIWIGRGPNLLRAEWYDRDGCPVSLQRISALLDDSAYRQVARSTVMDAADPRIVREVSTIWIGRDQGSGYGPPLIYETAVFAEGEMLEESCEYYATDRQAYEGHVATVVHVSTAMQDPVVIDVITDRRAI